MGFVANALSPLFCPVYTPFVLKFSPCMILSRKFSLNPRASQAYLVYITDHAGPVSTLALMVLKARPGLIGLMLSTVPTSWIDVHRAELK